MSKVNARQRTSVPAPLRRTSSPSTKSSSLAAFFDSYISIGLGLLSVALWLAPFALRLTNSKPKTA